MKDLKNKNGITLIALVITIIVMLILVAVTISMAINGGLFEKAGKAVGDTKNEINKEQGLANGGVTIDGTYYNSIDEYLNADKTAVHDWKRTGDTFTCNHCSKTYEMGQVVEYSPDVKVGLEKQEQPVKVASTGKINIAVTDGIDRPNKTTTITAEKSGLDKYYTANSNSYPTEANVDENGNQIIGQQYTNWVVLGREDTNKDGRYETLLITSESDVEGLYFYGAAAYNNAASYVGADGKKVEGELDRICRELYSNSEYGIARSMTIEDVNSCLNNPLQAMDLGGMYQDASGIHTTGNLTTKLKDIPTWNNIKGNHFTPDGANTEDALGNYELNGYMYMLNEDGASVMCPVDPSKTSSVTEVEKNTIFGSSNNYMYWLASRGVFADSDFAYFGPGFVYEGGAVSYDVLFYSDGDEFDDFAGLRPVVSLKSKLPEVITLEN